MSDEGIHQVGEDGVSRTKHDFVALPTGPTVDDIYNAIKNKRLIASENVTKLLTTTLKIGGGTFHFEQFTFGHLPVGVISAAQKDGLDFIDAGLFQLPYKVCMYRCAISYKDTVVGTTLLNVEADRDNPEQNGIATVLFTHSRDFVVATHSINVLKVKRTEDGNKVCELNLPAAEYDFWREVMVTEKGVAPGYSDLCDGSMEMVGLTMILNTKGIRKERFEPPRKPNMARARAGRPLLPYTTRVYTDVYLRAVAEGPTGTHASPRPHLRRAHVRHYTRDDGRDWYTKVEAMLVNWDGQPLHRGQYEVKP